VDVGQNVSESVELSVQLEYHKYMRRWLVIFMLFLLPIRGLVGDAMAYSMLPTAGNAAVNPTQNAMHSVAARAIFDWAGSVFGHENSSEASAKPPCHLAVATVDNDDPQQSKCTTCQVCHLSAATPVQLPDALVHTAASLPQQRDLQWHSAEPRQLFKTPVF
jgi:hypothetical protein